MAEKNTQVVNPNYNLDIKIAVSMRTENGQHFSQVTTDLATPFTTILFALNQVTDSLNATAKQMSPEQLLRATLKDVLAQAALHSTNPTANEQPVQAG